MGIPKKPFLAETSMVCDKNNNIYIFHCLMGNVSFDFKENRVGLWMKIVRKKLHFYPIMAALRSDIRGVDGDDMLLHSRS